MAHKFARTFMDILNRFGALPVAGAIGVATGACTLIIHNNVFESIILTTGLNEMIPAAAPPLGMTARLAIAFTAALMVMGICAVLFSSWADADHDQDQDHDEGTMDMSDHDAEPRLGLAERLRNLLPFNYGGSDAGAVRELSDLPRVRRADGHPDAPARAPLLAGRDLAEDRVDPAADDDVAWAQEEVFAAPKADKPSAKERLRKLLPLELLNNEDSAEPSEPLVVKKPQPEPAAEAAPEPAAPAPDIAEEAMELAALSEDADADETNIPYTAEAEAEAPEPVSDAMDADEPEDESSELLADMSIDALIDRLEAGLDKLSASRAHRAIAKVTEIAPVAAVDAAVEMDKDLGEDAKGDARGVVRGDATEEAGQPTESGKGSAYIAESETPAPTPVAVATEQAEKAFQALDEAERAAKETQPVSNVAPLIRKQPPVLNEAPADTVSADMALADSKPAPATQPDDVDAALKAALETLRQMTEKQRNAS